MPRVGSTVTYPFSLSAGDTGSQSGMEEERNAGLYGMVSGILHLDSRNLRYSFGVRWVQTLQNIISPVAHADARNNNLGDGGKYPVTYTFLDERHMYQAFLHQPTAPHNIFQAEHADGSRTWISFGLGYKFSDDLKFNLGYTHLFVDDGSVDHVSPTFSTLVGHFESSGNLLAINGQWRF